MRQGCDMPGVSCTEVALTDMRRYQDLHPPGPVRLKDGSKRNPATSKWLRIQEKKAALQKRGVLKKKEGVREKQGDSSSDPVAWPVLLSPLRTESDVLSVTTSRMWDLSGMSQGAVTPSGGDRCEMDSGVSSDASPPFSGHSSPCPCVSPTKLIAVDCEMVGTGPGGRYSEVARCSLVNYYGVVLYDKYIKPLRPVVNYRTRWSGISKHHLVNAVPFVRARREILQLLKGKVIVGHALHNDFRVLGFFPPRHMIRDTSRSRELRQLSAFPLRGSVSLKNLAKVLLHRKIQVSPQGHSSVEDAVAAMDLYKLVETQWEENVVRVTPSLDSESPAEQVSSPRHYMQDQYWPEDISNDMGGEMRF